MIARLTAFMLLLLVGRASLQLLRPVQGIVNTAVSLISYVNENYGQDGYKFIVSSIFFLLRIMGIITSIVFEIFFVTFCALRIYDIPNTNTYKYVPQAKYATDDQTVREEKGEFVNGIWTVTGLVKWLSPDKKTEHTVKYKADDTGYHSEQESRISPGVIASLAGSGIARPIVPEAPRPTLPPATKPPLIPQLAICAGTIASLCG